MRLRRWASTCTRRWIFNISSGVAVFPLQLLSCKLFAVITVVTEFIVEGPDLEVMQRSLRKPGAKIVNTPKIMRWLPCRSPQRWPAWTRASSCHASARSTLEQERMAGPSRSSGPSA